jgi:hypothetical protein
MSFDLRNLAGRRALAVSLAICGLLAATRARATDDDIDDPKLARRLGTRMDWVSVPGPPPVSVPSAPTAGGATPPAVRPLPLTSPSTAPLATSPPPVTATSPPSVPASAPPEASPPNVAPAPAPPATLVLPLPPSPTSPPAVAPAPNESAFALVLPRAQLAFRRFDFVRIGASDSSGLAASEAFDALSLDFYPVSSVVRFGLSTAYGWQAGMTSGGDYFATETASLGAQLPFGRVVPFAEGLAGVGYMRRLQFAHTVPTVFWQLGIDLGAAVYFARVGFVSLAIGYLHPVNGFLKTTSFESVYTDTWSFKIGVGI